LLPAIPFFAAKGFGRGIASSFSDTEPVVLLWGEIPC
jgi:hypothetical protein